LTKSGPSKIAGLNSRLEGRGTAIFWDIPKSNRRFGLRFALQTTFPYPQLVPFSPRNSVAGSIDKRRKVRADTVRHSQHPFHCGVPKPALHQAQHGFGNARTLGDGVLGKLSAFALSLQKPNDFFSDGLVMSDSGHYEGSQQQGVDTYIAMVKYWPMTVVRFKSHNSFTISKHIKH
jgi:hypothetical protein